MKSWYQKTNLAATYSTASNDGLSVDPASITAEFLDDSELADFFGGLQLLRDVPASYLVPDDSLLPPESLRLFHLDQNWINCLLDGAMSIGRNCALDKSHDTMLYSDVESSAFAHSAYARADAFGLERNEAPEPVRTGFLLRSQLVGGWPGLELKCFQNGNPIPILRLDVFGDAIILCIADGILTEITLTEPTESLHFSVEEEKAGQLFTQLVSLKTGLLGASLPDKVKIPMRGDACGVIDITRLAIGIDAQLNATGHADKHFSSLEMAVEMLNKQSVVKIQLTGGWAK